MTCVRVASWRVLDHTSRTDKAWVLVWSALVVKTWSLTELIAATLLSRVRCSTALSCLWSLPCLLSSVFMRVPCPVWLVSTPACGARCLGCAIASWTVGVREHLIRKRSPLRDVWWSSFGALVHLGYAYSVAVQVGEGVLRQGPYDLCFARLIALIAQYLDVPA